MPQKLRAKTTLCLICVSLITFFSAQGQRGQSGALDSANAAYNQFKIVESRAILERIVRSPQSGKTEKALALQTLAVQDWKVYRNFTRAENSLKSALLLGVEAGTSNLLLGNQYAEAGMYKDAYKYAEKAALQGKGALDRNNAELLKAEIIHNESVKWTLSGKPVNQAKLAEAAGLLQGLLLKQPGRPKPAELLVGISLLRKKGADVLDAWKAYYLITREENINKVLLPAHRTLLATLPALSSQQRLSEKARNELIKALAASRFYNYAAMVATSSLFTSSPGRNASDPAIKRVIRFQDFIVATDNINRRFYPQIAAGLQGYAGRYDSAITVAAQKLWLNLDAKNSLSNYSQERFFSEIKNQFGAEGYIGTTNGYHSMLLGLIIHDETRAINQYGYQADFRYIILTRLISMDFTTWYGAANVGGWGTATSMLQVRDAYLKDPFTRLSWVSDTTAFNAIVKQISAAKARDLLTSKENRYAEPTFLSPYLRLKEAKLLFEKLQKSGLNGAKLYSAFVAETMRLNVEATVFAHEGRHAIDQLFFKTEFDSLSHDERELRAKLSEVRFSSNPKLALTGSIFGSKLDVTTPHGKANYRFRKLFSDWMEQHGEEIKGIEKGVPLLMQIDLLQNEQIVAICESVDPLYRQKK